MTQDAEKGAKKVAKKLAKQGEKMEREDIIKTICEKMGRVEGHAVTA